MKNHYEVYICQEILVFFILMGLWERKLHVLRELSPLSCNHSCSHVSATLQRFTIELEIRFNIHLVAVLKNNVCHLHTNIHIFKILIMAQWLEEGLGLIPGLYPFCVELNWGFNTHRCVSFRVLESMLNFMCLSAYKTNKCWERAHSPVTLNGDFAH